MKHATTVLITAFAAVSAVTAAEFRATALTPEYILVQGDCSAEESAAFFADPRAEEAKNAGKDWQVRRAQLALHQDIEKTVREPFAEKMKANPTATASSSRPPRPSRTSS